MTSVLMQPGTYGLDAASFARVTDFHPAKEAGADWLSFYVGGNFGVSSRQVEAAWAAGLPIMPNFERSANAALGGYDTGRTHALTALAQLQALRFEGECPVIFSGVDFGPTASQFPALDAYHRALVDILPQEGWTGGAYGPRSYLQHLNATDWWPADWPLWHWGGDGFTVYEWAWCKQWYGLERTPIDSPSLGYSVDENTLLKPMKFWSGYGADRLEPDVEEDMTSDEHQMLADVHRMIWANGTNDGIYFAVKEIHGSVVATNALVNKIIAALPAGGGTLTKRDITDAVNEAMRLISLTVGFETG